MNKHSKKESMKKTKHLHIIAEHRSGSTSYVDILRQNEGIFEPWADISPEAHRYGLGKWYVDEFTHFNSETTTTDVEMQNINKIITQISQSKERRIFKTMFRDDQNLNDETKERLYSLNSDKIVLMRRNKFEQTLSHIIEDKEHSIHISPSDFSRKYEKIIQNFKLMMIFAKANNYKIEWYEDIPFEENKHINYFKKKSRPKGELVTNLEDLIMRYYKESVYKDTE